MPTENGGDASQNDGQTIANQNPNAKTPPKRESVITARDELLARMDAQIVEQRSADDETFFQQGDPRAIALAAEMGRESRGERIATDTSGRGRSAASGEEGIETRQPIRQEEDPAERAVAQRTQVDARGQDPLADWIVEEGGQRMFKTVVDGREVLVPLEKARQQLQKHLAADIRLQQAAEQKRQLDAREAQLRQREQTPIVKPPVVDEAALERESMDLVRSLVSEPEAVAAKKLTKVLTSIRAAQPQVDVDAISRRAVTVAKQEIAAEGQATALTTGLQQFQTSYQDIANDPDLFALADRRTNAIAARHPDWSPTQVMMEAGRQTQEWVDKLAGKKPQPKPNTSGKPADFERQQRKQNLTPMPQPRTARPAAAEADEGNTPQDALADIRKARGQQW